MGEKGSIYATGAMGEIDLSEPDVSEKRYIRKQLDFDALMEMDEDKRNVIIRLLSLDGFFNEEVRLMIEDMGLLIDEREGVINEIMK